ncbi:hypothetical protein ISCGN_004900 [Ixodes scapularis]|uniref:Thioredoxin/protein disulfide isomerase n=1 Tax=Ixodes scapularis TaxID=6945 RepID=B7P367_IXOSC|nr:conserved hypothetical protein [Ixodes scapularis]|eukprot:XP_002403626.1 conserved hypothetical protein [Ixodes scapularis]
MFCTLVLPLVILLLAPQFYAASNDQLLDSFNAAVTQSKRLLVIFTQECCACTECVEAEEILKAKAADLEDDFGVTTFKVTARRDIEDRYGVTARPSIIFFRDGIPALYEGQYHPDSIIDWVAQTLEPATKALNDDTFEHLTQAATGATTGNWLVVFYKDTCVKDEAATSLLEGLSSKIKGTTNVAKVDMETCPGLVERFKIKDCPTIYFFRLGKMYRYEPKKLDVKSLKHFAEHLYKNMKAHPVPVPQTPFDRMIEHIAAFLKEHRRAVLLGFTAAFSVAYTLFKVFTLKNRAKTVKKE